MGIFHISRSHGVGNHDFFVIKFFSAKQDYFLPKKSRYDKIQGIKTKGDKDGTYTERRYYHQKRNFTYIR